MHAAPCRCSAWVLPKEGVAASSLSCAMRRSSSDLSLRMAFNDCLRFSSFGSSSVRGRGTPSHSWHRLDRAHPLDLSQVGQRGDAALPMWTKSSKVDRVDSYLYMCSEADSEILLDFASQWEGLSASARTCRRPE